MTPPTENGSAGPPADLTADLAAVLASTDARVGLCVLNAAGELLLAHREGETFTQASAIKIPILWELYRAADAGELSLEETVPVAPANGAGGCGVLQHFLAGGSVLTLADLAVLMIVLSDNVATNLVIDRVTIDAVNRLLDTHGAPSTRLRRKMMDAAARAAGHENTSSPAEAARLMTRLDRLASHGDEVARQTIATLELRKESPVTAALPKTVRLATKPGGLDGLRTEWSLVGDGDSRYAVTLMADGADDSVLEPLFRQMAKAIHKTVTTD